MSVFKYYINNTQVHPLNKDEISLNYEKTEDGGVSFEEKLDSALIFKYDDAFDFKAQEANDPTEELTLIIKRKCSGVYSPFTEIYFTVAEGEFDDHRGLFTVSAKSKNAFAKDIPVNIIIQQNRVIDSIGLPYNDGVFALGEQYKQAFYFGATILSVAQESNPKITGIVSDFFQINPETISSDCLPGIENQWTKLVFCALSFVQYPAPSNEATVEEITFSELMTDLNVLFDVFWFIDADYNLRIEHRSFFDGIVGLNITTEAYRKYVAGTNKYTYEIKDVPRIQKLSIAGSTQYAQLKYGYYGKINKNDSTKNISTSKIRTDYTSVRYYNGGSTEDGLFLFACETGGGNYSMLASVQGSDTSLFLSYESIQTQNLYLTPFFLMFKIHTYGRYDDMATIESYTICEGLPSLFYQYGQLRAGGFKSNSVLPIKKQTEISIPSCCGSLVDIEKKIVTELGEGVVTKAKFDFKSEMMKLELKHQKEPTNFTPASLEGLRAWYRGDSGIITTGAPNFYVTRWEDSSGNGHHADSVPGSRPNVLGYPYGVSFQSDFGTPEDYTFLESITPFELFPAKRGHIFVLYEINASAFDPSEQGTFISNKGPVYFDISFASGLLLSITDEVLPQHFYCNKGLYSLKRFTDDKVLAKHNGVKVPEYQYVDPATNAIAFAYEMINPSTIDNTQPTSTNFKIGFNSAISTGVNGLFLIKEVIIYDRELTDDEAEKVELYIASRGYYGIYARSSNHL
jgi:hypothetical protein